MADESFWRDARARVVPAALVALVTSGALWLGDAWLSERTMSSSWLTVVFLIGFVSGVFLPWKAERRDNSEPR